MRRSWAAPVGGAIGLAFLALLLIPYRDDYSETGPDPGVRRVSWLSNALDRTVDGITIIIGVGLSVGLAAVAWIILMSISESRGEDKDRPS